MDSKIEHEKFWIVWEQVFLVCFPYMSRGSSVGAVTRLEAGEPDNCRSILGKG